MPRSGHVGKRKIIPDAIYNSPLLTRFVNRAMKDGEKDVALKQLYQTMDLVRAKAGSDPLEILTKAVENVKPQMEVHARRIGGAAYQVPQQVRGDRKESLAIRWIILAARSRSNKEFHSFAEKLSTELMDAAAGQGAAIKKKLDMHRMAEANKAFAHFRW